MKSPGIILAFLGRARRWWPRPHSRPRGWRLVARTSRRSSAENLRIDDLNGSPAHVADDRAEPVAVGAQLDHVGAGAPQRRLALLGLRGRGLGELALHVGGDAHL